ncbi:MAG TPA: gamma-glutamyltransferase [Actinomycetota bacterium]|nr:gamma-glutamyltransferase [Actinomycetota bacterium]
MSFGAEGPSWAISTPHTAATDAGVAAFERGGNALDAALHAAITLTVAYPHMCGVGGDLFALIQRPDGEVLALNASGRSPRGADPEAARTHHPEMPERGPVPVTVPGAVSGWHELHANGAELPWSDAFEAAARLAFDGIEVSHSLADILADPDAPHAADPLLGPLFYPAGAPLPVGATVVQSALGTTLATLAERGPGTLYGGALGAAYAEGLAARGVPVALEDLAAHRATILAPLRAPFGGFHVSVVPPNSQGFTLLEILALADRLGLDADPHGPDAGTLARVVAAAARDRERHLADPDAMLLHPSVLLDDGHLAGIADEIRAGVPDAPAAPATRGDTVALVAADARGWAVSLIQSLFWDFGSGIGEETTGIVAQNRGACFTLQPDHPNAFAPGKLPAHTLMPALVHDERGLAAVAGTMGGYGQPQIDAQTIAHAIVAGRSAADAIAAPRWIIERREPGDAGPLALVEEGLPTPVVDAIASAGFATLPVGRRTEALGHAHLIRLGPGGFDVGSDPRADGGAAAG